jgi:hypothetical protein
MRRHLLPEEIEEFRDARWRRQEPRVQTPEEAERFVEEVGFAAAFADSRRPGPSLYMAVCGRRDAVFPPNVQKDPETSLTWQLKDALMRRGKVYYAKLGGGRTMLLAPRMIRHFHAIRGVRRREEARRLSGAARDVLRVLRREWEMGTADLRSESGVSDRKAFNHAMDELQAAMIVVPAEAVYEPRFTYIWEMANGRFPSELAARTARATALREIARCFLENAGMTVPGELARVTGLSRPDAGLGNKALVRNGAAVGIAEGTYRLAGPQRL